MSLNKESQLGFSYTLRGLVSREVIYSSSSPTMYGFQRIKFVFRFSSLKERARPRPNAPEQTVTPLQLMKVFLDPERKYI